MLTDVFFVSPKTEKKPCFSLPVSKKENPKDKINRVKTVNKQDFSNLRQKAGELQKPQSPFAHSLRNGECSVLTPKLNKKK